MQALTGVVCSWSPRDGGWSARDPWGFIQGDDGRRYFVLGRDVVQDGPPETRLERGERVAFEVLTDQRGVRAVRVYPIYAGPRSFLP